MVRPRQGAYRVGSSEIEASVCFRCWAHEGTANFIITINYDPSTKTDHHTRTYATWATHSNQPHAAQARSKGNSSAARSDPAAFLVLVPTEPKSTDTKNERICRQQRRKVARWACQRHTTNHLCALETAKSESRCSVICSWRAVQRYRTRKTDFCSSTDGHATADNFVAMPRHAFRLLH